MKTRFSIRNPPENSGVAVGSGVAVLVGVYVGVLVWVEVGEGAAVVVAVAVSSGVSVCVGIAVALAGGVADGSSVTSVGVDPRLHAASERKTKTNRIAQACTVRSVIVAPRLIQPAWL